jgi:hypothetical protein
MMASTTPEPARSINSNPVTEPLFIAAFSMARICAAVSSSVIGVPFHQAQRMGNLHK